MTSGLTSGFVYVTPGYTRINPVTFGIRLHMASGLTACSMIAVGRSSHWAAPFDQSRLVTGMSSSHARLNNYEKSNLICDNFIIVRNIQQTILIQSSITRTKHSLR